MNDQNNPNDRVLTVSGVIWAVDIQDNPWYYDESGQYWISSPTLPSGVVIFNDCLAFE